MTSATVTKDLYKYLMSRILTLIRYFNVMMLGGLLFNPTFTWFVLSLIISWGVALILPMLILSKWFKGKILIWSYKKYFKSIKSPQLDTSSMLP